LKAQAAFVTDLLTFQKGDKAWKEEAEANIRQVQAAGNKLEDTVRLMGEEAIHVRLEQADINKQQAERMQEMENEICQL
jgi:hypothetical protein